jgi:hypothetical protein
MPLERHSPLPYVRPWVARVALLRSPVLPTAIRILTPPGPTVQHPTILGVKALTPDRKTGHFYRAELPDISNGP